MRNRNVAVLNSGQPPVIDDVAFKNPIGQIAELLDPYTEGAKVGVMMTLASVLSAYLGPDVRVRTARGTDPLAIWAVLVGKSGIGCKGATARISMPVVRRALAKWQDNIIAGLPSTGLGIMSELSERDGDPVFILEEEGDDFIANAKKDVKIGVFLRKGWDGHPLRHKTSKDEKEVKEPHFGFIMHVQPKNWGRIAGSRDATGGTYNRFLTIWVQKSKTIPVFASPDPEPAIKEAAKRIRDIVAWAGNIGRDDPISVENEVSQRFEEWHRPTVESLTEGNEELSQMAERSMAYMIRLAGLFAVSDKRTEINEGDLDSALAIVRYGVDSIRYVMPEETGGESLEQKILQAVNDHALLQEEAREAGEEIPDLSMTELRRNYIGNNIPVSQINQALLRLPQIRRYKDESSGGRKPVRLALVEEEMEVAV